MPVSRRDFLKIGAVVGGLMPLAQSLGADAACKSVAIVGAGRTGRRHLLILRGMVSGQIVAVADTCVNTQQTLAKNATRSERSGLKIFCDSAELLAEVHPDILVCAIPGDRSAPVIASALRAGCDVLVDHRRLPTANEWKALEALAYRRGRMLRLAAPWQTDPGMRALIASANRAGGKELQQVHLECTTPFLAATRGSVREEIADLFPVLHMSMRLPFPDAPCAIFAAGSPGAAGLRRHASAPGFVATIEWETVAITILHRLSEGGNGVGAVWRMTAESESSITAQRADETTLARWRIAEWEQFLGGVNDPAASHATRRALRLADALAEAWQTGRTLHGVVT